MYTIGIVACIGREAIMSAIMADRETKAVEFRTYRHIKGTAVMEKVIEDINNGEIQSLILEYQTVAAYDSGLFWENIHKRIPEFPVVVLAARPGEAKGCGYIDPDKIYDENVFLNDQLVGSRFMIRKIYWNMERYAKNRKDCEDTLTDAWEKLRNGQDVLSQVIRLEDEVKRYRELKESVLDAYLDMGDLKKALKSLKDIL